jgi:hypothetical protein
MAPKKTYSNACGVQGELHLGDVGTTYSSLSRHLFIQSKLFDEMYIFNDLPNDKDKKHIWSGESTIPFQAFCTKFRNFCETLNDDLSDLNHWSERDTINDLIKKVLECLGYGENMKKAPWAEDMSFSPREYGAIKTWKPDFVVVKDPSDLDQIRKQQNSQDKINVAKGYAQFCIEAKYWGRIGESERGDSKENTSRSDNAKPKDESSKSLDFREQCLKYTTILGRQYGVLTDGKLWRIYHAQLSESCNLYYEFNLCSLIQLVKKGLDKNDKAHELFLEMAKYFYFFFSPEALCPEEEHGSLLDELIDRSKKYASDFREDLKLRFVNAMKIACNGFSGSKNFKNGYIELSRSVAESHLFNVLFIRYCESQSILPIKNIEYTRISISGLLNYLRGYDPTRGDAYNRPTIERFFNKYYTKSYDPSGVDIYESLIKLTKIIQTGINDTEKGFEIKGFKESLFSKEEWSFANHHPINNQAMIDLLFELGYVKDKDQKFKQIPYSLFTPRQLGSIYESFLEFRLERAESNMIYTKRAKKWEPVQDLSSEKVKARADLTVKKDELFFVPNNKERKDTGSYYTPDLVTKYIVKETLNPLVVGKSAKEIIKLRVCDPAMGSGHFLGASLDFLTNAYHEALDQETHDALSATKSDLKQEVLHKCIFGVDLNSRAVKLAKMSLWLETADPRRTLEPLDDQLKCANSLTDYELWKKKWKFFDQGIDAVVGNPPYLGEDGHKEVFREISQGFLKTKYLGKMDLFYFFFHLGIQMLKQNGRLGFITTNYFTTAMGAKKLREDFYENTNLDLMINLNELKVFGEATGQHNMITLLTKASDVNQTKTISTNEIGTVWGETSEAKELFESVISGRSKETQIQTVSKTSLFDGDKKYIRLGAGNAKVALRGGLDAILDKVKLAEFTIKQQFSIKQGLVSGANKVTDEHLEKYKLKNVEKGDGVFVISSKEVRALNPSKEEKELIKPFYKNSDIFQFGTSKKTDESVLYLDRLSKTISKNMEQHLSKARKVLDQRREAKNGVIKWFQLQWPRERDIFTGPKIVCPQRSHKNTFGYNEVDWFAASDVYFIVTNDQTTLDIKYALALLNSKLYYMWFYFRGKRKGEALELFSEPLFEAPIRDATVQEQETIIKIVDKLIANPDSESDFKKLNEKVYKLYGLTKVEIAAIEEFYDNKLGDASSDERTKAA